jgi:hypothetical protein
MSIGKGLCPNAPYSSQARDLIIWSLQPFLEHEPAESRKGEIPDGKGAGDTHATMGDHELLNPDAKPIHKQLLESGEANDGMEYLCPVRACWTYDFARRRFFLGN